MSKHRNIVMPLAVESLLIENKMSELPVKVLIVPKRNIRKIFRDDPTKSKNKTLNYANLKA